MQNNQFWSSEEKALVCENNLQQLLGLLENVSQGAEVGDLQVVWKEERKKDGKCGLYTQ